VIRRGRSRASQRPPGRARKRAELPDALREGPSAPDRDVARNQEPLAPTPDRPVPTTPSTTGLPTLGEPPPPRYACPRSSTAAGMAKSADARDLGSRGATRGGSSPPSRTTLKACRIGVCGRHRPNARHAVGAPIPPPRGRSAQPGLEEPERSLPALGVRLRVALVREAELLALRGRGRVGRSRVSRPRTLPPGPPT
jgi:hypothetical protein